MEICIRLFQFYLHPHPLSGLLTYLGWVLGMLLRHCLHGRSFICNRIGFDAVTPFVYMAPSFTEWERTGRISKTLSNFQQQRKNSTKVNFFFIHNNLPVKLFPSVYHITHNFKLIEKTEQPKALVPFL